MTAPLRISDARIHALAIPMRFRFEHAAATREVADPIIVELNGHAPYAHLPGIGETLARPYVTGETSESVLTDLQKIFLPRLAGFSAGSFPEALEFIESLPFEDEGRIIHAARCAVELALIDLAGRAFRRRAADVAGWMGLAGFGAPGSRNTARYSGIAIGSTRAKLHRWLRIQRCYGLRDFKLKVAVPEWQERLAWTYEFLATDLKKERVTLRVDANSGWTASEAAASLHLLERFGVCAIEQPLKDRDDAQLSALAAQTACDLIVDESLLGIGDARRLLRAGGVQVFNIRLAKVGGLMPALAMAAEVLQANREVQLGCLVGQTSILTAAEQAFLEACPKVRFVEGAFGRILLKADPVRPSMRFGYGGRLPTVGGFGLGVTPDSAILQRYAVSPPQRLRMMGIEGSVA
ncbi:MAG: enolase C-terminal domain-like protein [Phycisphaerae bacterium]|nr:enolase C-terminal domain-like protein [Phycisphaerae bacterium]